jgi:uncharacterized membrane protein YfcA
MTASQLAVVIVAMLLGAVVKGAIGTGLPTIAIPVMAGFLGAEEAVVIMAIPTVVTNTWLLWNHRSFARQTRDLPALVMFGVVGVVAGVWVLTVAHPGALLLVIASVIVVYVTLFLSRPELQLTPAAGRWLSPPAGTVAGALQGATGVSGPVLTIYTHALRIPRRAYLFQLAAQIQVFAVVQVIGQVVAGLYTTERVGASLLAIVPAVLGLPVGMLLSSRLQRRTFERVVLVFLAVMAVKLIVDGLGQF